MVSLYSSFRKSYLVAKRSSTSSARAPMSASVCCSLKPAALSFLAYAKVSNPIDDVLTLLEQPYHTGFKLSPVKPRWQSSVFIVEVQPKISELIREYFVKDAYPTIVRGMYRAVFRIVLMPQLCGGRRQGGLSALLGT